MEKKSHDREIIFSSWIAERNSQF